MALPEQRDDYDNTDRYDASGRGKPREYYLAPLVDAEVQEQKTLAGVNGDPGVLGVMRRYGAIYMESTLLNERNERNMTSEMQRMGEWLVGMRIVRNERLREMFPLDIETGARPSDIRAQAKRISREITALDNLTDAYAYQLKKGSDVGGYANMIKGDYDRVVPQAVDYEALSEAGRTELPVEEIGTEKERLAVLMVPNGVVHDYFKEPGKTDLQIASEIEKRRMGVMTDQSMRIWEDVAKGKYGDFGPIFTKPKFHKALDQLAQRIASSIGPRFGYKAEAMSDSESLAYQDCLTAARRGLMMFRQLDLDMQYCAYDNGDGALSEVDVELVHNDAGKMAYFALRLFQQSTDKSNPFDVGISRSVKNSVHNLVQAAPMCIGAERVYVDPTSGKNKSQFLSMMHLWEGYNGQKGLRLDQLPWGKLDASGTVVEKYFDAALGVVPGQKRIAGFTEDCFNVPYCLGLSYAYKYFSIMTESPMDALKRLSNPAELGGLNKPMETYLMINFAKEFGSDGKDLLGKVLRLDKCNLLIASAIAVTQPGIGNLPVQSRQLVDVKSQVTTFGIEKFLQVDTMINYAREVGFLTDLVDKDAKIDQNGNPYFTKAHMDDIRGKQEREKAIILAGVKRRRGITIEESGLFTAAEAETLRKSQLFAAGYKA